jgi:hypothetical protein
MLLLNKNNIVENGDKMREMVVIAINDVKKKLSTLESLIIYW